MNCGIDDYSLDQEEAELFKSKIASSKIFHRVVLNCLPNYLNLNHLWILNHNSNHLESCCGCDLDLIFDDHRRECHQ